MTHVKTPAKVAALAIPAVQQVHEVFRAALATHQEASAHLDAMIHSYTQARALQPDDERTALHIELLDAHLQALVATLWEEHDIRLWLQAEQDLYNLIAIQIHFEVTGKTDLPLRIHLRQLYQGQKTRMGAGEGGRPTLGSEGDKAEIKTLIPYFLWQAQVHGSRNQSPGRKPKSYEHGNPDEIRSRVEDAKKGLRRDGTVVTQTTVSARTGIPQQTLSGYKRDGIIDL